MLVEDQVKALERRQQLLKFRDLDVIPASSKQDALARLRSVQFKIDVAVTDLHLEEGTGSLGGVEVAEAIADNSGGSIPIYAYSGKTSSLEKSSRRFFREVVLKSESSAAGRELFDRAATDASEHFGERVRRGYEILKGVIPGPRRLDSRDVALVRDLVVGSMNLLEQRPRVPEAVGLLRFGDELVLPYGLEWATSDTQSRVYATVLGHEYIYGVGREVDEAAASLEDVLAAFVQLLQDSDDAAFGQSKRLRALVKQLLTAEADEPRKQNPPPRLTIGKP